MLKDILFIFFARSLFKRAKKPFDVYMDPIIEVRFIANESQAKKIRGIASQIGNISVSYKGYEVRLHGHVENIAKLLRKIVRHDADSFENLVRHFSA